VTSARPLVVISGRHRPHEILLLVVAVVTGVAYTVGAPPPASVAALLPGWAQLVWSVGLGLSGVVGLVGVLRSPRVEAAGMLLGTAAMIWYAVAVAPYGWRALLAGAIAVAWAAANLWRAMQIRRDLKGAR
jgi:hypothetical protein